jgi:AraC-like DNA-binding protein
MARKPHLELVQVRDDQSFKIWSHGYPYRTVRWHFHPEYELHLVTATAGRSHVGDYIGSFGINDMVLVGPNLPHNWISDVPPDEIVSERCLVLQFTAGFIDSCLALFPELRFLRAVLTDAYRGVRFPVSLAEQVRPLLTAMLTAQDARRLALFMEIAGLLGHESSREMLASIGFQPDPSAYLSATMNTVLRHIGCNFTSDLREADLAALARQSVSAFSRSFRRDTGMVFVQYVNSLRIELACQYLCQAELPVTDICYAVGFNNISNFNRRFLAAKGMPPSRFRALHRMGAAFAAAAA